MQKPKIDEELINFPKRDGERDRNVMTHKLKTK